MSIFLSRANTMQVAGHLSLEKKKRKYTYEHLRSTLNASASRKAKDAKAAAVTLQPRGG